MAFCVIPSPTPCIAALNFGFLSEYKMNGCMFGLIWCEHIYIITLCIRSGSGIACNTSNMPII